METNEVSETVGWWMMCDCNVEHLPIVLAVCVLVNVPTVGVNKCVSFVVCS